MEQIELPDTIKEMELPPKQLFNVADAFLADEEHPMWHEIAEWIIGEDLNWRNVVHAFVHRRVIGPSPSGPSGESTPSEVQEKLVTCPHCAKDFDVNQSFVETAPQHGPTGRPGRGWGPRNTPGSMQVASTAWNKLMRDGDYALYEQVINIVMAEYPNRKRGTIASAVSTTGVAISKRWPDHFKLGRVGRTSALRRVLGVPRDFSADRIHKFTNKGND